MSPILLYLEMNQGHFKMFKNYVAYTLDFSCWLALISTGLMQLDDVNRLAAMVDKLHQAGKIHILQQACGVSGCVGQTR